MLCIDCAFFCCFPQVGMLAANFNCEMRLVCNLAQSKRNDTTFFPFSIDFIVNKVQSSVYFTLHLKVKCIQMQEMYIRAKEVKEKKSDKVHSTALATTCFFLYADDCCQQRTNERIVVNHFRLTFFWFSTTFEVQ